MLRGAWLPFGLEEGLCQFHPLNMQLGSTNPFECPLKVLFVFISYTWFIYLI